MNYYYNDFYQLVNDVTAKNKSNKTSLTGSITTFFNDKWPELEVGYTKEFNSYKTVSQKTQFNNDDFFVEMEYDFLKDFKLSLDYSYAVYQNNEARLKNIFNIGNASIFYQREDSPWGFEIKGTNLFNVQYKRNNSFSNFLISDSRTFIIPRIVMFKIMYKF